MLIEITQHNMDNDTDKIIDRTEEILKDSTNGDIDAIRDTSNYINWLTVLASGGIALVISQKDKISLRKSMFASRYCVDHFNRTIIFVNYYSGFWKVPS